MKVFFIRHGKDDGKYRGGWSETDLVLEGMEQSKLLANHMKRKLIPIYKIKNGLVKIDFSQVHSYINYDLLSLSVFLSSL